MTPSSDTFTKAGEHVLYEWLLDYQQLAQRIGYLEYKLEREKRELKRWVHGDLAGTKLHPESIAAKLEEHIAALEYELAHVMNDLFNAKKLISSFEGLENKILYGKYVEGKTLAEVAHELGYTPGHVYNKHAEIMKRIDFASQINFS